MIPARRILADMERLTICICIKKYGRGILVESKKGRIMEMIPLKKMPSFNITLYEGCSRK